MSNTLIPSYNETCFGFCEKCNTIHSLGEGNARAHCYDLMAQLEREGRIDFDNETADPQFTTDYLWGIARGKMFGVLECENSKGEIVVLKAFSCQYNGAWKLSGWCSPLLDYSVDVPNVSKILKDIALRIDTLPKDSAECIMLKSKRKKISQKQMKCILDLYTLTNFREEKKPLREAIYHDKGIPTGTAECCAPKLLDYAAKHNLKPLGLAEFYWGKESKSGARQHGEFYPCCETKCQPILGYILCGLEAD